MDCFFANDKLRLVICFWARINSSTCLPKRSLSVHVVMLSVKVGMNNI
jgi:hypothetical protein